jgi:hypothetical protein
MTLAPKNNPQSTISLYYSPSAWFAFITYLAGWGIDIQAALATQDRFISGRICLSIAAALEAHLMELSPYHREWLKGHAQRWRALGRAGGCLACDETTMTPRHLKPAVPCTCPECDAVITRLAFVRHATILGTFDAITGHEDDPVATESGAINYFCPQCCADLFDDENSAAEFLKGPQTGTA